MRHRRRFFPLRCLLRASRTSETPQAGAKEQPAANGAIHIEFPGRVVISVECGADPVLLRSILESLRK
jgi:hypothetical protein